MSFPKNIRLVIGLGNPGRTYANTYHNAGFLALDYLMGACRSSALRVPRAKPFECFRCGGRLFVRPLTFMNESGAAAAAALKFYRAQPEEMLVIHDDSDLTIGTFKIAFDRGAAGHRGVQSVIRALRTNRFWRLRLGIRKRVSSFKFSARGARLPDGQGSSSSGQALRSKAGNFVLKNITASDKKILYSVFGEAMTKLIEKESP